MTHPGLLRVVAAAGHGAKILEVPRFDFYAEAKTDDVCCVVATGDQRLYANLLLTIGVRPPNE
jgi:L-fucose mutarotase